MAAVLSGCVKIVGSRSTELPIPDKTIKIKSAAPAANPQIAPATSPSLRLGVRCPNFIIVKHPMAPETAHTTNGERMNVMNDTTPKASFATWK